MSGRPTQEQLDRLMAVVLAVGVAVSATLVAIGFAASFAVGWTGSLTGAQPAPLELTDFGGLMDRLLVLQPLALVQLGLIILIATPVVRVAVTAVAFALERDRLYVGLSLAVLGLLALSLLGLR